MAVANVDVNVRALGVDTALREIGKVNGVLGAIGGGGLTALAGAGKAIAVGAVAGVTAIGAPGAGLAVAIAPAIDFQKIMAGVGAVSGASAGELAQLSQLAIKLGQDTTLAGVGAADAARAMEVLAQAGFSVGDMTGGVTRGVLLLASATGTDFARAAEIAGDTFGQFRKSMGLGAGDMEMIANQLVGASNVSSISLEDLGLSMKYVGGFAAAMGIPLQSVTAAMAALGNQGVKGEQAGTGLRGVLASLASPSNKARDAMRDLGLNFRDAQGNMLDFAGIAGVLQRRLSGLSAAEREKALVEIFGRESLPAALALMGEGAAGIDKYTKAIIEQGNAAEQGRKRNDNLAGDLEQLSSSVETARIALGQGLSPALRVVVQWVTKLVNAGIPFLTHAFADMADGFGKGLRDLNRAGGQVGFFRTLGKEARNFLTSLRALRGGGGGIAALAKALGSNGGTLALGFRLIAQSIQARVIPAVQLLWRTFAPFTGGQAGQGLTTFQRIVLGVAGVIERLARIFQLSADAVVTLKQALHGDWFPNSAGNAFVNIVGNIGMALSSLPDIISENKTRFSSWRDVLDENLTRFDGLLDRAGKLRDLIATMPTPNIPAPVIAGAAGAGALAVANPGVALAAGRAGIGALGSVASVAISIIGGLVAILGGPLTLAIVALVAAGGLLYAAWVNNWGGIRDVVLPILDLLAGGLLTLGQWIQATAQQIATFLTPYVLALGGALQQGIVNATPGVTAFFTGLTALAQAAWPTIQLVAGVIQDQLGPAFNAFFSWATTAIPMIGKVIGDSLLFVGTMLSWLAGVWKTHHDAMTLIFLGFWNVIAGLAQVLWGTFQNIITVGLALLTGDWQLAWDTMLQTVNNFNAGIGTILTGLAGIFGGFGLLIIDLVKTSFATAGDTWVGIGTSIVDGIKTGITSKWEELKGVLAGLVSALPGPVQAILQAHSPSRLFADQVGATIPQGIAAGILEQAGLVAGAIGQLPLDPTSMGAVVGSLPSLGAPFETVGGVAAGSASPAPGGTVVHLTYINQSPLTPDDVARAHAGMLLTALQEALGEGGAGMVAPPVAFGGGRS